MLTEFPIRFLDRKQDILILERRLPHWSQAGTLAFITWRTADSMPGEVLERWFAERDEWLQTNGIDPRKRDWRQRFQSERPNLYQEFRIRYWNRWHDELDQGHGACVLRRAECAEVVAKSLKSSDGSAYILTDFVVMPNHVHLLAAFRDEDAMVDQCKYGSASWRERSTG
jgi:type I restriction enzyme R subunit